MTKTFRFFTKNQREEGKKIRWLLFLKGGLDIWHFHFSIVFVCKNNCKEEESEVEEAIFVKHRKLPT